MGAGLPAHVHGQAVRKALQEAQTAGLTLPQLCRATKRTPSQVWAGLRFLRKVAVKEGLPPVTYSRRDGFQMSEESEVRISSEWAVFQAELHRVTNFITGIIAPHAKKAPDDEWIRLVLDQLGGVSWITRARRNVRDYERLISHSEAHITWTFITLMVRRLTRPPRPPRTSPHPVEPVETSASKLKPIRIRMQPQATIRLAPACLR